MVATYTVRQHYPLTYSGEPKFERFFKGDKVTQSELSDKTIDNLVGRSVGAKHILSFDVYGTEARAKVQVYQGRSSHRIAYVEGVTIDGEPIAVQDLDSQSRSELVKMIFDNSSINRILPPKEALLAYGQ